MFNNTGWSYQTSSGAGLTVGELAEVTIQHTRLYISSPSGDQYKIIAQGVGGGVGASIIPGSVTGSTADFVSAGTNIYSLYNEPIGLADLSDFLVIYSGNAVFLDGSGSGSVVLFVRAHLAQLGYLVIPLVGPMIAASQTVKAFCFIAAAQLSTPNLGVDGLGTFYSVLSADKL